MESAALLARRDIRLGNYHFDDGALEIILAFKSDISMMVFRNKLFFVLKLRYISDLDIIPVKEERAPRPASHIQPKINSLVHEPFSPGRCFTKRSPAVRPPPHVVNIPTAVVDSGPSQTIVAMVDDLKHVHMTLGKPIRYSYSFSHVS